jgi:hypothetical protein
VVDLVDVAHLATPNRAQWESSRGEGGHTRSNSDSTSTADTPASTGSMT